MKKIKSIGWNQNNKICLTIYKTLIRSLFDYSFIPLCCDTQKILSKCEKLQNRILRTIKWFPLKTRTTDILKSFKITSIKDRSIALFKRFINTRKNNDLLKPEIQEYNKLLDKNILRRFTTLFDLVILNYDTNHNQFNHWRNQKYKIKKI